MKYAGATVLVLSLATCVAAGGCDSVAVPHEDVATARQQALTVDSAEAAFAAVRADAISRARARHAGRTRSVNEDRWHSTDGTTDAERVFVTYSNRGGVRTIWAPFLEIPTGEPPGSSPEALGRSFLMAHSALFGVPDPASAFRLRSSEVYGAEGDRVSIFDQHHDGRPVFGASVTILGNAAGYVTGVVGHTVPENALPKLPTRTPDAGLSTSGDLGYFDPDVFGIDGDVRVARRAQDVVSGTTRVKYTDASTGELLHSMMLDSFDHPAPHRETFSCVGCTASQLPGQLRFDDECHFFGPDGQNYCVAPAGCAGSDCYGGSAGSSALVDQHVASVEHYLWHRHGQIGWDNHSLAQPWMRASSDADSAFPIVYTYGHDFSCDASWRSRYAPADPAQVVLGSRRWCLDVVAHEFIHGVDDYSGLISNAPCTPGLAVAEGISDVFGELVEEFTNSTTDWIHGAACPSCPGPSRTTRLSAPSTGAAPCHDSLAVDAAYRCAYDGTGTPGRNSFLFEPALPQPASYSDYRAECGGWYNSTIASTAGWLMGRPASAGAVMHNGISVTGIGPSDAGGVFFDAMRYQLAGSISFSQFRNALYTECANNGVPSLANCLAAVDAMGLWSADEYSGISHTPNSRPTFFVDFSRNPDRYYMWWTEGAGLWFRYRDCPPESTTCSWSSGQYYGSFSGGSFHVGASMRPAWHPSDLALICYHNASDGIWCESFDAWGAHAGPDPNGSGVLGSPTLAYFKGWFHLVYKKTDNYLYHRRLSPHTNTWTAEKRVGATTDAWRSPFTAPDLASSSEQLVGATETDLWLVWTDPSNRIALARWVEATDAWTSEGHVQQHQGYGLDCPGSEGHDVFVDAARTQQDPQIAFYRGRLHMTVNRLSWTSTLPSTDSLWYGSCSMPACDFDEKLFAGCSDAVAHGDWTRFVRQDGSGRAYATLDHFGAQSQDLVVWHRLTGSNVLYRRFKRSE